MPRRICTAGPSCEEVGPCGGALAGCAWVASGSYAVLRLAILYARSPLRSPSCSVSPPAGPAGPRSARPPAARIRRARARARARGSRGPSRSARPVEACSCGARTSARSARVGLRPPSRWRAAGSLRPFPSVVDRCGRESGGRQVAGAAGEQQQQSDPGVAHGYLPPRSFTGSVPLDARPLHVAHPEALPPPAPTADALLRVGHHRAGARGGRRDARATPGQKPYRDGESDRHPCHASPPVRLDAGEPHSTSEAKPTGLWPHAPPRVAQSVRPTAGRGAEEAAGRRTG